MLEIVYNFGKIVRNTIYTKKSIGTQSREKYTRQGVELLATYELLMGERYMQIIL